MRGRRAVFDLTYQVGQRRGVGIEYRCHAVPKQRPGGGARRSFSGDKDGDHRVATAFGVEIEQVERVILHLLAVQVGERTRSDLEFQHQDGTVREEDRVDPSLQSQEGIFQ